MSAKSLTIEMPSGNMTVRLSNCIGRHYEILMGAFRYEAICIDATHKDEPKRMRIPYLGRVAQKHEYQIIGISNDWED